MPELLRTATASRWIGPRRCTASFDVLARSTQNRLLAAMEPAELQRLLPRLEWVELKQGQVLYEPGSKITLMYFPATCVVTLLYGLADGACDEIALIGSEGVVDVSLFLGSAIATSRAVVQNTGASGL